MGSGATGEEANNADERAYVPATHARLPHTMSGPVMVRSQLRGRSGGDPTPPAPSYYRP